MRTRREMPIEIYAAEQLVATSKKNQATGRKDR